MTDRKLLEILHDNMVSAEYARVKQQILDGTSTAILASSTYRPIVTWTALAHKISSADGGARVYTGLMWPCVRMIGVCQRSR